MKFEEILKACSNGKMPRVESIEPIKYTSKRTGIVTTIKANGKHYGIGVTFDELDFEIWFHESAATDKRTRYMRQLKMIES